jgi:protein-S-isoprenylcysteine O-methyltransferase Ste14
MLSQYDCSVAVSTWRWTNVPVPEAHLAGVAMAVGLRTLMPATRWNWKPRGTVGQVLCVAGLAVIARSVRAAGQIDVARPTRLVSDGPFAFSRNPMYVGWALLHLGVGMAAGSAWIVLTLPAAICWIHGEILQEERALSETFGDSYTAYRAQVPRYLPIARFLRAPRT